MVSIHLFKKLIRFPHEELKTIYYQELDYKKAEGLVNSFKKILDFNLIDKNDFVKTAFIISNTTLIYLCQEAKTVNSYFVRIKQTKGLESSL